jgi:hypothetical protein
LYYSNGRPLAKGKIVMCKDFKEKYPCIDSTCRKTGRWTYYYKSGKIERKEYYQKIKDCDSDESRTGWWKYYSEQGQLLRKEEYRNNILWNSDVADYYLNTELAGKIQVKNGVQDTLEIIPVDTSNLIRNGDFSLYYGSPVLQINDGQNQIENQIPFWYSPDKHTPDYYNPFRRLKNVPDNINTYNNVSDDYLGLILYHHPTNYYSEYITGELKSGLEYKKSYCLKIVISMSQNSGYVVDQFGLKFSKDNHSFEPNEPPDIQFSKLPSYVNHWDTLCAEYISTGKEKYITVGRFIDSDKIKTFRNNQVNESEGDFNQSAYYLIDSIQLIENITGCKCENKNSTEDYTIW